MSAELNRRGFLALLGMASAAAVIPKSLIAATSVAPILPTPVKLDEFSLYLRDAEGITKVGPIDSLMLPSSFSTDQLYRPVNLLGGISHTINLIQIPDVTLTFTSLEDNPMVLQLISDWAYDTCNPSVDNPYKDALIYSSEMGYIRLTRCYIREHDTQISTMDSYEKKDKRLKKTEPVYRTTIVLCPQSINYDVDNPKI